MKRLLVILVIIGCGTSEKEIGRQLYDCRSTIPSSSEAEVLGQMGNCLFIRYGWKDTAKVIIAAKALTNKTTPITPVATLLVSLTDKQARLYVDSIRKGELRQAYKDAMRSSLRSLAESEERYFADQGVAELVQGGGYADRWVCDSRTPPHTIIFCMDSTNMLVLNVTRKGIPDARSGGWSAVMTNPKAPNVVCAMFFNTTPVAPAKDPLAATCADVDSTTIRTLKAAVQESLNSRTTQDSAAQARRRGLAKARVDSLTSWWKCEVAHVRVNTVGETEWENLTTDCYHLYPSNGDEIFYQYINHQTFADPAKIEYLQRQSRKIRGQR